jgi:sarcosine oxidase
VERLERGADAVRVETAVGTLAAGAAVVTAGAWARGLLEPLGIELPVVATRETVTYYALEPGGPLPSVINAADGSQPGYAVTAPGVGLKAGLHQTGSAADPDELGEADQDVAARTAQWVASRFRAVTPLGRAETCLYTTTDDDRFLLERHGRVVVGSPCSGHGFKFAPAVGRRLAGLALEALS